MPAGPPLPGCAPAIVAAVSIPQGFPADVPLPGGLVLHRTDELPGYPGSFRLTGYASTTIGTSYRFIRDALPRAGYVMSYGESEANDMELQFTGGGWKGAYRVMTLIECTGLTGWTISVLKR